MDRLVRPVTTRRWFGVLSVTLVALALGCSDDGHSDPTNPTAAATRDEGSDGFDIARPKGDWSIVASGVDGAFEWTILESVATKPTHRCLGWVIKSSDDATQELIDQRQSKLVAYDGVPYSCAPAEAGKGYDVVVPLVTELFAGTDRGLVAGFTTNDAVKVKFATGNEAALVASSAVAKVFAGTVSSQAPAIDVEFTTGERSSCRLEPGFEPNVLTIC
jgi:hypothetical protein